MLSDLCSSGLQTALFEEVYGIPERLVGERKLWAVTLIHGLTDAARAFNYAPPTGIDAAPSTIERQRREDLDWVYGEEITCDEFNGVSFCWVCEQLNLDPGRVRAHFEIVWKDIFAQKPNERQKNRIRLRMASSGNTKKKCA